MQDIKLTIPIPQEVVELIKMTLMATKTPQCFLDYVTQAPLSPEARKALRNKDKKEAVSAAAYKAKRSRDSNNERNAKRFHATLEQRFALLHSLEQTVFAGIRKNRQDLQISLLGFEKLEERAKADMGEAIISTWLATLTDPEGAQAPLVNMVLSLSMELRPSALREAHKQMLVDYYTRVERPTTTAIGEQHGIKQPNVVRTLRAFRATLALQFVITYELNQYSDLLT
ncbi:hypothetical protein [Aliagarivorans taiwanensis]|uniref:hypothetical protein n=1 Tax=Aliagarivorans taiwanensis TaxID=561966 RepID=UPI00047D7E9B|nr:hypothetical protein [Aliagarivorans taiwanensis]